jgi:hypothetical protein
MFFEFSWLAVHILADVLGEISGQFDSGGSGRRNTAQLSNRAIPRLILLLPMREREGEKLLQN